MTKAQSTKTQEYEVNILLHLSLVLPLQTERDVFLLAV